MDRKRAAAGGRWGCATMQGLEGRVLLAATFRVTTTADSGAGSLRQAILDSNASAGADVIQFSIGQGHVTIAPLSKLPNVTGPVTIDGTTQPGYAGQPVVEISGASIGGTAVDGLTLNGGSSVVRGLVINGFSGSGVYCQELGGNVFENNYVGTDASGRFAMPNGIHGIILSGENNRIGGPKASQRNVISGNGQAGVFIAGTKSVVQGNLIGVDVTGSYAIPNVTGVAGFGNATNNTIGGSGAGEGNVMSGNTFTGALVGSDSWTIAGNTIGLDATRSYPIANGDGIITTNSSGHVIGGATAAAGNVISGNGRGIYISGGNSVLVQNNVITGNTESGVCIDGGTGHHVTANSIFDNRGLGIDLWPGGVNSPELRGLVTENTPGGPHAGPNNLQNFPVLTSARTDGFATTVVGTLNSTPQSRFTIDFYSSPSPDPTGHGEGKLFLGSTAVTTDGNGNAAFNVILNLAAPTPGDVVAATATAADGSTSEFSLAQFIGSAPAPAVAAGGFSFLRYPHEVTFTFTQRVERSIDRNDVVIRNLATGAQFVPVDTRYDEQTETARFLLPQNLADGDYEATLKAGGVENAAGTPLAGDGVVRFFELRGDANRDRKVDFNDLVLLAQSYNSSGGRTLANGDFDGNGNVDFNDLVLLAQRYNTTLKPVGAAAVFEEAGATSSTASTASVLQARREEKRPMFSVAPVVRPVPVNVKSAPRRR